MTRPRAACLIGWPAAHSRSPLIHHYWLRTLGIEGGYVIEAVPPRRVQGFPVSAVAARLRRRQRHHSAQGARAGAVEAGRTRPRGRRRQYAVVSRTASCARPTPTSRALSTISTPARPAGTEPRMRWCSAPAVRRARWCSACSSAASSACISPTAPSERARALSRSIRRERSARWHGMRSATCCRAPGCW